MITVTTDEIDQVLELRGKGATPRHIARTVGLRQAEVSALLRQFAKQGATEAAPGPVVGCWVSGGWADGLTVHGHSEWPGLATDEWASNGLASVLVARRNRHNKISACGYLIDAYCLGVKNAFGPRVLDDQELVAFRRRFFEGYEAEPLAAPLELVQHLVFGAIDFARGLGFEPHADYAEAAWHLGVASGPWDIQFGREGKPYYVQGPYDDPRQIMRTLDSAVGDGNYHYLIPVDALGG